MTPARRFPRRPYLCCAALAISVGVVPAAAADRDGDPDVYPRVVAEVLFGTSGFEPGLAAEWRFASGGTLMMVRPEVLINEDGRPGGAVSLNWMPDDLLSLPDMHSLSFGPRLAYHNSDDSGWEGALLAIWHINIAPGNDRRHYIEVIGAAGILEDKRDNHDDTRFAGTVGVGYGFQF